jgi:hypothetical protein
MLGESIDEFDDDTSKHELHDLVDRLSERDARAALPLMQELRHLFGMLSAATPNSGNL